jgi:archaellum component FlaC
MADSFTPLEQVQAPTDSFQPIEEPAKPQLGFFEDLAKTRREQIEAGKIKVRPEADVFSHPINALGQAAATMNLPFAYAGITPLMDVVSRRYVGDPIRKGGEAIGFPKTGEVAARTGELASQMFMPETGFKALSNIIAPLKEASSLKTAAKAGEIGKDIAGVEGKLEKVETAISPRVQKAVEKVTKSVAEFPAKISPRKLSPEQVGAEYGGTTIQPSPRLNELGLYGEKVGAIRKQFNEAYGAVEGQMKNIPADAKAINEAMGSFVSETTNEPLTGKSVQEMGENFNQWLRKFTPEQIGTATGGKDATTIESLKQALGTVTDPKATVGAVVDKIKILRDQGRRSSSMLVEHLRNSMADKLEEVVNKATEGTGLADQWRAVNRSYREAQPFIGWEAIPGKIARNEYAENILNQMFPKTGQSGFTTVPRVMKQFLGEQKWNEYTRTFDESMFSPKNMKASMKTWREMTPEQKNAIYGPELAKQKERLMNNFAGLEERMGKVETYTKNLDQRKSALEKDLKKLGYQIKADSPAGEVIRMPSKVHNAIRVGKMAMILNPWSFRQLEMGINQFLHGVPMWQYHALEFTIMATPALLPSMAQTAKGAAVLNTFLEARQPQEMLQAVNMMNQFFKENGTSADEAMAKAGIVPVRK